MPYDALSVVTVAASASLLFTAASLRSGPRLRVALILLAAFLIRADAVHQWSLHVWDESFHALVARNLLEHPLRPVLYRDPALPYDPLDWMSNHIWLHKPPGALWLMAGSLGLFGVNEIAVRVPSVLLSTASVLLTFLIGRHLVSSKVGLLAAGFQAVNGFLVALAAGRRVSDHVDTTLIFCVELVVWAALTFERTRRVAWIGLAGMGLGAGVLTKSWPALVALPVLWIVLARAAGVRRAAFWSLVAVAGAAAVAMPWTVFTWSRYPAEAAGEALYTFRHMTEVLEEQRTPWWTYFADLPRFFGELTPVGLAIAAVSAIRDPRRQSLRVLLVWVAVPYVLFSVFATRLPAYVMTAAPAIFLLMAAALDIVRDRLPAGGPRRKAGLALLVLAMLLTARHLLEPAGPFEKRDRRPEFARRLARLDERLRLPRAVLFNVPKPIDAMFYSGYTAYERMPTEAEVRELVAQARPVVIYQPAGRSVSIPSGWPVTELRESENLNSER